MDDNQVLLSVLIPSVIAPVSVAVVGYWVKSQLKKVEQISTILIELQYVREKQTEIKIEMERFKELREDFILLRSEVKTQWARLDELKERVKGMGGY